MQGLRPPFHSGSGVRGGEGLKVKNRLVDASQVRVQVSDDFGTLPPLTCRSTSRELLGVNRVMNGYTFREDAALRWIPPTRRSDSPGKPEDV